MTPSTEALISELAARQHGLVTRAQLLEVGVRTGAIKGRVRSKRLRPVHRGVYRVGPLVSPSEREMAAVLACGSGAVVSHRSAAVLWRLLSASGGSAPIEVTVPSRERHRRPGVRVHGGPPVAPDEAATVQGIPVTAPARTVADLAGVAGAREVEQALARAEREGRATPAEVSAQLRRHPTRAGVRLLRTLLEREVGPAMTRSAAEDRLLELIDRVDLPRPETNVKVAGHEVDFVWRAERLVVEVDGFAFHSSRSRFEGDRRKDATLATSGIQVIRFTWRQIADEPEATMVRLAQALSAAGLRSGVWVRVA